jgi:WD40 repeat protein
MRVETPQILWHSEEEKSINAALMCVSLLGNTTVSTSSSTSRPSGNAASSGTRRSYGNVLATAGNSNLVHLWKISLPVLPPVGGGALSSSSSSSSSMDTTSEESYETIDCDTVAAAVSPPIPIFQKHQHQHTKNGGGTAFVTANNTPTTTTPPEYMFSFTRHEGPVNAVAFSPDGFHLATCGETGTVLIWSVPVAKRGGGPLPFWAAGGRAESDWILRRVTRFASSSSLQGMTDVSWSADSKRFMAGAMDHSVWVCENVHHYNSSTTQQQQQHQLTTTTTTTTTVSAFEESDWKIVYHNGMDHTHYVQGVAYDPVGVYLASQSSDRSVRVFPRKKPATPRKKAKKAALLSSPQPLLLVPMAESNVPSVVNAAVPNNNNDASPRATTTTTVASSGSGSTTTTTTTTSIQDMLSDTKLELGRSKVIRHYVSRTTTADDGNSGKQQHLFADESTLGSFVRRLAWTVDGAFLVTPGALWADDAGRSSYATLLFARHRYDEPFRVLYGLDKVNDELEPSVVMVSPPAVSGTYTQDRCHVSQINSFAFSFSLKNTHSHPSLFDPILSCSNSPRLPRKINLLRAVSPTVPYFAY